MSENTVQNLEAQAVSSTRENTFEPNRWVSPAVDIYETQKGLSVVADLPGIDRDSLSISVEKDVLTIKGSPNRPADRAYVYREFEPVGYFRQFTLGKKIDQTAIKAEYKHGVLNLELPFAAELAPRVIEVKVA